MKSHFKEVLWIVVGGFLGVALSWLLYLGIYLTLESLFYPNNPQAFPAGTLRMTGMFVWVIVYFFIYRTKWSDLVKATLLVPPLTILLLTLILYYYQHLVFGIILLFMIISGGFYGVYRYHKPWFFNLSIGLSTVMSLLYAWPR